MFYSWTNHAVEKPLHERTNSVLRILCGCCRDLRTTQKGTTPLQKLKDLIPMCTLTLEQCIIFQLKHIEKKQIV